MVKSAERSLWLLFPFELHYRNTTQNAARVASV